MNKDHVKGKIAETKGTIKKTIGRATNDPDMEAEGEVEETGGKLRGAVGDVKSAVRKASDAIVGKK